jgi:hypothetical protein
MVSLSQESIDEFRARTALETALSQLDASWLILVDLRINGPTDATAADYVALHPRRGIALIDVILSRTGDPAQRLRKFLDAERFSAQFPGTLPVVRLVLRPTEATTFARRVHAAFAAVPPITIADPSWVTVVNDLLVPGDPSAPRPVLPLFKRSGLRGNGTQQQPRERPRQTERPQARPDETRAGDAATDSAWADDTWAVTPERWPDKVAAATPLKRSGRPSPDDRRPSPDDRSSGAAPPSQPRANAPEAAPGAQRPSLDNRAAAAPRTPEPTIAPEEFPPPSDETIAPQPEIAEPSEEPAAGRVRDWPVGERSLPPAPDQEAEEPQARSESTLAGLARAGQQIISLVQFPARHDAEMPAREMPARETPNRKLLNRKMPRTARRSDNADRADSPSIVAPIIRLAKRQHDRGRPLEEPTAEQRYEREHDALDSGLTARWDEAFSEQPPAAASWRGHAVAAVILVALIGGGIAWLSGGDSADRRVASLPPVSTATPLPAAPPVADTGSTGTAPKPSTQSDAPPRSKASSPDSAASVSLPPAAPMPNPAPPAPPPPAATAQSAPAAPAPAAPAATPPAAAVAPPPANPSPAGLSSKDSSVAGLTVPPPVAPPVPKAKPTPPPAAPPTEVAKAPEPPAAQPTPAQPPAAQATPAQPAPAQPAPTASPEPKSKPPRALAEKSTPRTKARKTAKTEQPEDQPAPAAATTLARAPAPRDLAPRDLAPRDSSTRDNMRGPPIDLADLPPGETVAPSSSPAPLEQHPPAAAPSLASAAAARMHGPTSLLPPSPNAPASAQAGSSEVCRSYTSTKTLLGQRRQVSGLACRDTNGQWQIITELPD